MVGPILPFKFPSNCHLNFDLKSNMSKMNYTVLCISRKLSFLDNKIFHYKHCQRPRVLSHSFFQSFFQLKSIWNDFGSKRSFKLWTQYPGSVVPLAMFLGCATCIAYNIGHHVAPLALVANLVTRWHHLHKMQIWPTGRASCINCKFCHQVALLASVANLATRWGH